jgi:hypothetical protein
MITSRASYTRYSSLLLADFASCGDLVSAWRKALAWRMSRASSRAKSSKPVSVIITNCRPSRASAIAASAMPRPVCPDGDSYAAAIGHKLGDEVIISAIREVRPPFSPAEVINTVLLPLCKAYGLHSVTFDNYAAGFAQNLVRNAGLAFDPAKKHKSELFLDPFLPLLNSRKIRLPRNERAINQICSLERSSQRSGRDQISAETHGHDDIANVIAGVAELAHNYTLFDTSWSFVGPTNETDAERKQRESDENFRWRLGNYMRSIGAGW